MKDFLHLLCAVISFIIAVSAQISVSYTVIITGIEGIVCLQLGLWLTNSVPISVDRKPPWHTTSLLPGYPVFNNVSLLLLFVLQHRYHL